MTLWAENSFLFVGFVGVKGQGKVLFGKLMVFGILELLEVFFGKLMVFRILELLEVCGREMLWVLREIGLVSVLSYL